MKPVKRKTRTASSLSAKTDAYSTRREKKFYLCGNISLLVASCFAFGGIFIHLPVQDQRITRWHIPCEVIVNKSARGSIWKISNRREAIIHEKKKTNSNSDDSFRQCWLRSKLTLRSRRSGKWAATATNTTNHTEPTSTAN